MNPPIRIKYYLDGKPHITEKFHTKETAIMYATLISKIKGVTGIYPIK